MVAVTPIVALDVPDRRSAEALVGRLGAHCDYYKVGLELYAAEGPAMVTWLRGEGKRVFVDLKLHDIPNTVRGAARSVARLGASLLTVHAVGGEAMVRAAVEGASAEGEGCEVLAVTVLTSLDAATVATTWGRGPVEVTAEVVRLAGFAAAGGAAGVVCSGHELSAVRSAHADRLGCLVPGLRLAGSATHDQQRVMTPGAAARAGARWLVLGRAVTSAADPVAALAAVRSDVALAMTSQLG